LIVADGAADIAIKNNVIPYAAIGDMDSISKDFFDQYSSVKKIEILAWYCPKIPIPFGPKGYSNLPGLILELKIGPIIYLATKIKLNQKEKMKVRKPTKGKILSEEEFDKMLKGLDKRKN
jgi:GLPGLI family protein